MYRMFLILFVATAVAACGEAPAGGGSAGEEACIEFDDVDEWIEVASGEVEGLHPDYVIDDETTWWDPDTGEPRFDEVVHGPWGRPVIVRGELSSSDLRCYGCGDGHTDEGGVRLANMSYQTQSYTIYISACDWDMEAYYDQFDE